MSEWTRIAVENGNAFWEESGDFGLGYPVYLDLEAAISQRAALAALRELRGCQINPGYPVVRVDDLDTLIEHIESGRWEMEEEP